MDKKILISVIVPVYGTEPYIKKCVDSILGQTFDKFEVILVDDESKDNCPAICDEYCRKDSRFRVIHKSNEGLGMARNSGLELVRGEYFTFVDSDDWLDSNHLKTMYSATKQGQMDAVIAGCKHCTEEKVLGYSPLSILGSISNKDIVSNAILPIIAPGEDSTSELAIPMSVCFNIYKTSVMNNNGLLFFSERETVGEDLFFNLEFLYHSKEIVCLDWHGYNYRVNDNSISRKYNPERLKRTENYYRLLKQTVNSLKVSDVVGNRVERSTLSKFRAALRLACNSSDTFKGRYHECKRILYSDVLQSVLNKYPIKKFRRSIRIVSIFMKKRFVLLTMIAFVVEKKMKNDE